MTKKILAILMIITLLGISMPFSKSVTVLKNIKAFVHAEDEEEEHEEEEHEEEEDDDDDDKKPSSSSSSSSSSSNKSSSSKPKETKVVVEETIYKTITVYEPGYDVDTDGDKLVDAIDPDPLVSQLEYFTDSDNDGVPNVLDEHKGEDDFKYKPDTDTNNNGILDSYESL